MRTVHTAAIVGLVGVLATGSAAMAQSRAYVGFVYPAGGQQGTTFPVKLGGQNLGGVNSVLVSGRGVSARVVETLSPLGALETGLLSQQLAELKRAKSKPESSKKGVNAAAATGEAMMAEAVSGGASAVGQGEKSTMIAALERRLREDVRTPSCAALRNLVFLELRIDADAEPGERELRLVNSRGGLSNPMPFYIGQLTEYSRKPMITATRSVLGKEELALRKRPPDEVEVRIATPCTVNGQIASGEINRYRFEARRGQRIVINTLARQLIPFIADAVPGWFQPVLTLYDAQGKELAFNDDYRFKPDPLLVYQIPQDGEYVFTITDAIYRGREDFVYRITIGELPLITSVFPLGGWTGQPHAVKTKGWNLEQAALAVPGVEASPGVYLITASKGGLLSNLLPFAIDSLPECLEKESNDTPTRAQQVTLPMVVNGHINRSDDCDVYQFRGKAGDKVAAEVCARRLDSPLDSILKLTDSAGKVLALNDDHQDLGAGINTHHADSYLVAELPTDGTYYVHVSDTAGNAGEEYAYRLRISAVQPEFALRVVPSSVVLRNKSTAAVSVYAIRKDGFNGPIKLRLKNPPAGVSASTTVIAADQNVVKFTLKVQGAATGQAVPLTVEGLATTTQGEIAHDAVPAEDRMQAFLWRHLVPSQELLGFVPDSSGEPAPQRVPPPQSPELAAKAKAVMEAAQASGKKFSKSQVAGRVRSIKALYQQGLLTDEFYGKKVAECGYVE